MVAPKKRSSNGCPIARSLERAGDRWSILILRDAMQGNSRFDEFHRNLGIAPNMLTRRLSSLVDAGLMERRLYSEKPPRYEYLLTPSGEDFLPVLVALQRWGTANFSPEGAHTLLVDCETRLEATPVLVDARTGIAVSKDRHAIVPGPVANRHLRAYLTATPQRQPRKP